MTPSLVLSLALSSTISISTSAWDRHPLTLRLRDAAALEERRADRCEARLGACRGDLADADHELAAVPPPVVVRRVEGLPSWSLGVAGGAGLVIGAAIALLATK